jgi:hypothetical protein
MGGGFAGGRMSSGGGRGGSGGAVPAAAAPAVTNAVRTLTPTAENTLQTLAALTRENQGPMVVTFYAKEAGDYAKLANTLVSFAEVNAPTHLNKTQGPDLAAQQEAVRGVSSAPASAAPGTPVAAGVLAFDALQRNNVSVGLNSNGVIVVQNLAHASADTARARTNYQSAAGDVFASGGASNPSGSATQRLNSTLNESVSSASSTLGAAKGLVRDNDVAQTVEQVAARGGPYHVVLRPEQIEELARNYRLAAVARGDTVVQFKTAGDRTPQTVDAKDRQDLLRRSGLAGNQTTATAASQSVVNREEVFRMAAPFAVDCVITMEPAPTPAGNP